MELLRLSGFLIDLDIKLEQLKSAAPFKLLKLDAYCVENILMCKVVLKEKGQENEYVMDSNSVKTFLNGKYIAFMASSYSIKFLND